MENFMEQDYLIYVCRDIQEWAKEFYDIPENAEVELVDNVDACAGFANIEDKTIWIYVPENYDLRDLKSTVAHEIGHIIELDWPTNPPEDEHIAHEFKADYYMNYYLLVEDVMEAILENLEKPERKP